MFLVPVFCLASNILPSSWVHMLLRNVFFHLSCKHFDEAYLFRFQGNPGERRPEKPEIPEIPEIPETVSGLQARTQTRRSPSPPKARQAPPPGHLSFLQQSQSAFPEPATPAQRNIQQQLYALEQQLLEREVRAQELHNSSPMLLTNPQNPTHKRKAISLSSSEYLYATSPLFPRHILFVFQ